MSITYCDKCGTMNTSADICPRCEHSLEKRSPKIVVEVERQKIVDVAREMIGTPFKHLGRDESGIDCVGLMFWVAAKTGLVQNLDLPDYWGHMRYSRLPEQKGQDAHWLMRELCHVFPRTRVHQAKTGDFVFCKNERWVHLGIITPERMVHAYAGNIRKVVEHDFDANWKKRCVAVFRFPGAV